MCESNENNAMLSVVIPVYRVENYLQKCVDSILSQSYTNVEIILVDDCSPDSCPHLCDAIATSDSRVSAIHHSRNRGLSAARNSGIEVARGTYITFVDSDDFIAPDTYAPNMQLMRKTGADCLEFPVIKGYGSNRQELYTPCPNGTPEEETFPDWIKRGGFIHSYACNKIYKTSLWRGRRFPEGKHFEDIATIPYLLEQAEKIIVSPYGRYHYCVYNTGSITRTPSLQSSTDLLHASIRLFQSVAKNHSECNVYNLYMETVNRQIEVLRAGGDVIIPKHRFPLRDIFRNQPAKQRIKALLLKTVPQNWFYLIMK